MRRPNFASSIASQSQSATQPTILGTTNERIRAIFREVRGPDILHVGCVGHKVPQTPTEESHSVHFQLCKQFGQAQVLGLDIDLAGLQEMRQKGFNVVEGDAQNLNFDAAFDTILAGELIEHLQNPGQFLEGCGRALKSGGRVVISTPNAFSVMLAVMYFKNYDRAFNPEHVVWFCPQTLREIVKRCGFSVAGLYFVDDLEPELVSSRFYKAFVLAWKGIRPLFPTHYRNTMVAVLNRK
jgi:2-polyprenyl-3-methyl-5-hydroxy-6-metoxy-1,4-benzoquinol methylase